MTDGLYGMGEAAGRLGRLLRRRDGLSLNTFRTWVRRGRVRVTRKNDRPTGRGHHYFSEADLRAAARRLSEAALARRR